MAVYGLERRTGLTINTAMLVGLGFLIAALLAVLIAPAYRRRTVRLTTDALKRSLPLTEAEMRADKDRLRADHAIRIHNLEAKLESVTLSSARQKIEVNRRDARISELESLAGARASQIEELENARRVLEQTVTDRLPKIETRLGEARKLLAQRDTEVSTLAETAQKQARALGEATQINVQQGSEIERLTTAISTRAARNQDSLGDARFDGEIALRSEIEALRAKTRDQNALIVRLQELIANPATGALPETIAAVAGASSAVSASSVDATDAQIARLQAELLDAQTALNAARARAEERRADSSVADAELRGLKTANQDMAAELARLKAALASFESLESDKKSKDSPIAMKAKVSALEAQSREQTTTIGSLRAEVAAVNERLARQSAHYMEEMKRLGAGTLPASGVARPLRPEPGKRPLSERINDPRPNEQRVVRLTPLAEKKADAGAGEGAAAAGSVPLFSLSDQTPAAPEVVPPPAAPVRPDLALVTSEPANDVTAAAAPAAKAQAAAQAATPAPRRPRLLERITSIDKPGS